MDNLESDCRSQNAMTVPETEAQLTIVLEIDSGWGFTAANLRP